jgi:CDGSH-type Zn-finger protein/mannose-6-phosphate isomerase-like protein (cupin superfamily)
MDQPVIAHRKGYYTELEAGQRLSWCSCGRSANQPYCDGAHRGTTFAPVPYLAAVAEDVILCGCKHTRTPPFCDGTHSNLPDGYRTDDPDSSENGAVTLVDAENAAEVTLDGSCYVFRTARASLRQVGGLAYCPVIGPAKGALFQSQFYGEIAPGAASPVISADGRDTVLFSSDGDGLLEISGRRFELARRNGFYVRPQEAYRISNSGSVPIKLFITQGPGAVDLCWLDTMPDNFDDAYPDRRSEIDPAQRQVMAERFFQMMIHRQHGSTRVTQFIGNIPLSKAEPHRHLYEESLIFLNGAGVVWTENRKTPIIAGDVLFLPQKQIHSVQCTTASGLDVVGVIYPGDNPGISY